jgi:hypothetical protein
MALRSPQAAHRAAAAILAQGRFHQPSFPDPLRGLFSWIGNALVDPFNALGKLVAHLGKVFPGGVAGVWAAAAALLLCAAWLLVVRHARFQLGQELEAIAGDVRRDTPASLERAAHAAEQAQHWDEAVRLRFRAGILRLGQRLELPSTETIPNHVIGRLLRSRRFDSLAERFDEVAYGGGAATAADAEQQRREWPELLQEAGPR